MRTRSSYSGESARINERQRRHFNGRFDNIVDAMYRYIKEYRREEDRAIIAVVSNDEKKMQLESRSKKRWWKVRWGVQCPVRVATVQELQRTIIGVENKSKPYELLVLVEEGLQLQPFDISCRHIRHVALNACVMSSRRPDPVIIDGSSTFYGTRLDAWPEAGKRQLSVGHYVNISIRLDEAAFSAWMRRADESRQGRKGSEEEANNLRDQVSAADGKTWKEWKGIAAITMGILTGSATAALTPKATAGGFFINYSGTAFGATHTFQMGAAVGKVSMLGVGLPVVAGVAAAATVYFVDWTSFFGAAGGWLEKFFSNVFWFFSWLTSSWARIRDAAHSTLCSGHNARPMQFTD